jgi:hypothetical protein
VIALLVKRFSNELKAIFDPVNALFGSEEALLGVLSSRDHLVGCGTAFREAQNRLEASFIGATKSEALRALLYVEYGTQPTEGQKRDIEGLASQKKAEMKRVQEEREEAENRRRIADFDERFDSFFNELQAHFEEKMARLIQNPGGQEEGVMPLSATDSLDFLRKALEQKGILEQVRSSFYNNIPDDQISLTFLRESRFDDLVRKMDQKRTAAFEGGLATIERHCFRSDRFPLSPKDAFLKPLAFLVALYERFPNDERVKTVVGEAFGLIEDQKGKCGAGLLGRSFMLSRSLLQLLRSGVEKPFEQ